MRQDTLARWELTHLVKVFFCTASRSSEGRKRINFTAKAMGKGRTTWFLSLTRELWDNIKQVLNKILVTAFSYTLPDET